MRHAVLRYLLVATLAGTALPAAAIDDATRSMARDLVNSAVADYQAGRYDQAAEKLRAASESAPVPTVALWAARTEERRGHLVAASELYRRALQLAPNDLWVGDAQQQAQREAENELAALEPRIPKLQVVLQGATSDEVEVEVDGVVIPPALVGLARPVDTGTKRVVVTRGDQVIEVNVELDEGATRRAVVAFPADPNPVAAATEPGASRVPPPLADEESGLPHQRRWGWVAVGVGAAGIAVGTTAGIMVATQYSSLKEDCPHRVCESGDLQSRVDRYDTARAISTTGFVVGALGGAAGITLLLTAPPAASSTVGVFFGPRGAGVAGRF